MELLKKIQRHLRRGEKLKKELAEELKDLREKHKPLIEIVRKIDEDRNKMKLEAKRLAEELIKDPFNDKLIKKLQELKKNVENDKSEEREKADIESKKIEQIIIDLEAIKL